MDIETIKRATSKVRIGIVGDVMLDRYLIGEAQRLSPEAPVPVVNVSRKKHLAGGAANVAHNVVELGAKPILLSVIGRDSAARQLRETLTERGVSAAGLITDAARMTTVKTRVLAQSQQVVRLDEERIEPISDRAHQKVLEKIGKARVDAWIISDYGKGQIDRSLIEACIATKKPVIVDPVPQHAKLYAGVDYMTPNNKEARGLAVELGVDGERQGRGLRLLKKLRLRGGVLTTLGAEGMELQRKARHHLLPTHARQVYDVTGAGDTVISWFSVCLAAGIDADDAMLLANAAAASVVGKVGTAAVAWGEITTFLSEA